MNPSKYDISLWIEKMDNENEVAPNHVILDISFIMELGFFLIST